MKRYDSIRKKIDKMEKAIKGSVAPFLAYLNKIDKGYELSICFWDGKEGSGDKMPKPIVFQFSKFELAEEFLSDYLLENKPMMKFVLFADEEMMYD